MAQTQQQFDAKRARELTEDAKRFPASDPARLAYLAEANVYATLATIPEAKPASTPRRSAVKPTELGTPSKTFADAA